MPPGPSIAGPSPSPGSSSTPISTAASTPTCSSCIASAPSTNPSPCVNSARKDTSNHPKASATSPPPTPPPYATSSRRQGGGRENKGRTHVPKQCGSRRHAVAYRRPPHQLKRHSVVSIVNRRYSRSPTLNPRVRGSSPWRRTRDQGSDLEFLAGSEPFSRPQWTGGCSVGALEPMDRI